MVIENINSIHKNLVSDPSWMKGGYTTKSGYVWLIAKGHPRANKDNYVFEHVLIMEAHINRFLTYDDVVHHKNGIKSDNRLENLELLSRGQHTSFHNFGTHHRLGKHRDTSGWTCYNCGTDKVGSVKPNPPYSKTPRARWEHVPWDKVNWYCHSCVMKLIRYARNTP